MLDLLNQVQEWRAKGEELFAKANAVRNGVARERMLQMAEGYMRLADQMEDLAAKQLAEQGRSRVR